MTVSKEKTGSVIRLFLTGCTVFFLITATAAPDRSEIFSGLMSILMSPAQVTKDYFAVGSISGNFLSIALLMGVFTAMMYLPGAVVKGSTVAAYFLTMGFSTWGINFLNIWPFILGVFIHAKVRKQPFANFVDMSMFATALCPIASEMLLRYPGDQVRPITALAVVLYLVVGGAVGFLTPALAAHSPNLHKGFNLYSAGMPAGFLGFFLVALLYKTLGNNVPAIEAVLGEAQNAFAFTFCGIFFVACVVLGWFLNDKSFKGYVDLLKDPGLKADFTAKYGAGVSILNVGIYGLFITLYYVLVGASFNGVTVGTIFCMVCFAAAGAHPGNVWPIMVGYVVGSLFGVNAINAQGIVAGVCFASGLAPIAGVYGWLAGIVAGCAHYVLVTSVPAVHGGFCLYNGGFTSVVIALLLVPQLEMFFKTKAQRKEAKAAK